MKSAVVLAIVLTSSAAWADSQITITMVNEKGIGAQIGTVTASDSKFGLVLTPSLKGLTPGLHGFHVHQNPNCGPGEADGKTVAAGAAGGHLDPAGTKKHGTPWGDGHLGDLPPLYVDASGNASQPVLAPRLKVADLAGRAIVIHAGADNHSDHPAPLGGGGARVACGVIK
jgi:superoxide dismutase, Cu-Zn family